MRLRYFYKIDHKHQPIPGSNVRRKTKPYGHQWKEIDLPCCDPLTVPCTCGPRFFIQLDGLNRPVDGSLIKRFVWPRMETGIRYSELPWKSDCCVLDPITATIIDDTENETGVAATFSFCGVTVPNSFVVESGEWADLNELIEFLVIYLNTNFSSYGTWTQAGETIILTNHDFTVCTEGIQFTLFND